MIDTQLEATIATQAKKIATLMHKNSEAWHKAEAETAAHAKNKVMLTWYEEQSKHLVATIATQADELTRYRGALEELRDAAREYVRIVAGWFDFTDTDAHDELNAALVHADSALETAYMREVPAS